MGKKGKKGGKKKGSGGKKKGGKKGKNVADEMTPNEAILQYKIGLQEQVLADLEFHRKSLEEQRDRNKERNERLAAERAEYIKKLMENIKELLPKKDQVFVDKSDVIAAMKENWAAEKQEHQAVIDLYNELTLKDRDIKNELENLSFWRHYKKKGHLEHKDKIECLEREINEAKENFQTMLHYMNIQLKNFKNEVKSNSEEEINKKKEQAVDLAVTILDKNSKQEVMDNDWLKTEIAIHGEEMKRVSDEVEAVEQDNLAMMREVFQGTQDDLKVSRNIFLTQFHDLDDLEHDTILEIDLEKIIEKRKSASKARKKSALQRSLEEKYSYLSVHGNNLDTDDIEDQFDELMESAYPDLMPEIMGTDSWSDYLNVGNLELKMLCVEGNKLPLYSQQPLSKAEIEAQKVNPDRWPVTKKMLHNLVHEE